MPTRTPYDPLIVALTVVSLEQKSLWQAYAYKQEHNGKIEGL